MDLDQQVLGVQRDLYNVVGGRVELTAWQNILYEEGVRITLEEYEENTYYDLEGEDINTALLPIDGAIDVVSDALERAEDMGLIESNKITRKGLDFRDRTTRAVVRLYDLYEEGEISEMLGEPEMGGIYSALGEPDEGEPEALNILFSLEEGLGVAASYDSTLELLENEGLIGGIEFDEEKVRHPQFTERGKTIFDEVVVPDYEFLQDRWEI